MSIGYQKGQAQESVCPAPQKTYLLPRKRNLHRFQMDLPGEKKEKNLHVSKKLVEKRCVLDCSDWDLVLTDEVVSDLSGAAEVKVLDVNEEWIKIEYERRRERTLLQKEKVVKLADLSLISGLMLEVTEE